MIDDEQEEKEEEVEEIGENNDSQLEEHDQEVFGGEDERDEQEFNRHCSTCELIIDEDNGYVKCTDRFCPHIYCNNVDCYQRSWNIDSGQRFRCKPCYRGIVDHLIK